MNRRLLVATCLFSAIASCKSPKHERREVLPPGAEIKPAIAARVDPKAKHTADPAPTSTEAPTAKPASSAVAPPIAAVAGDVCKITRGPVQLPFTGQVTLWIDESAPEPRFVFNQNGVARAVSIPSLPKATDAKANGKDAKDSKKPSERLALSEPAERATWPSCAAAGGFLFCMDRAGAIHKSAVVGQAGPVIAEARAGSPMAASTIAGSHALLAYLADRKTTEGATTIAFAVVDDAPPVVLSEDGAGATFVALAPRGDEVVAMYIDARRVLTPVHARVITFGAKLGLGPDAVLFVGGGTEGRLGGAIAQSGPGTEHALIALEKDHKDFGMAAIRIEEQPRDDARVTWSVYPGGLDRAPLAATLGTSPMRVLRARPASAPPNAKVVLELGELDMAGVYKPSCPVAEGPAFGDLAIAVDRQGALWIAYTDADGTWIERRGK